MAKVAAAFWVAAATTSPGNLHSLRRGRGNPAAAFTLIELLVVIAIIIVLCALLLGGMSRVRSQADRTAAIHNISKLQAANTTFAAEHNGMYTPVRGFNEKGTSYVAWFQHTEYLRYLGGSFDQTTKLTNVPKGLLDPVVVRAQKGFDGCAGSYGYNCEGIPNTDPWGSPNSTSFFRMGQLSAPSRTAAFLTATDWQAKYTGRFLWKGAGAVEGRTGDGKIAYRHDGKAVVAYYDGHVGMVTMADMEKIDSDGNKIDNIFWNGDAADPKSLR